MKRSEFFKTLGLGVAGAAVAPSLLREVEAVKDHVKTDEGIKQAECLNDYGKAERLLFATGVVIFSAPPEMLELGDWTDNGTWILPKGSIR